MRSTVRIEDDLLAALKRRAEAEGVSLTRTLNSVLRSGLSAANAVGEPRRRFVQRTVRMGPATVDLDKALDLASSLEDAFTADKLDARK